MRSGCPGNAGHRRPVTFRCHVVPTSPRTYLKLPLPVPIFRLEYRYSEWLGKPNKTMWPWKNHILMSRCGWDPCPSRTQQGTLDEYGLVDLCELQIFKDDLTRPLAMSGALETVVLRFEDYEVVIGFVEEVEEP